MGKDTISNKDVELLEWNKNLIHYVGKKIEGDKPVWPIPKDAIQKIVLSYSDFQEKYLTYSRSLSRADCTVKNASKKILRADDRAFLNNYIRGKDYITDAECINLWIPVRDHSLSTITEPVIAPSFDIMLLGEGRLKLTNIRPSRAPTAQEKAALHGVAIRWGIMGKPNGRDKFRLTEVPVSGDDLPHPDFTRQRNFVLDLTGESGNRVYIAMRYENSKSGKGPWSKLVTLFIP